MKNNIAEARDIEVFGVTGRAGIVTVDDAEYRGVTRNRIVEQKLVFTRYYKEDGKGYRIRCIMRFDDQCGNGHEDFSITGSIDEGTIKGSTFTFKREGSGGCIHDEIEKRFPEFKHLIKWHLAGVDGPMHYPSNALYHANDKDCWGLRKGEVRQIRNGKTGLLAWQPAAFDKDGNAVDLYKLRTMSYDGDQPPDDTYTVRWSPWNRVGEGKARDLGAARSCAVWPEATDDELMADDLKEKLEARLPALLTAFKADMLSVGFLWPEGK